MYLILTFIAAVFWSLFWYEYSEKGAVLYIGVFGSASFLSFVMAYLYFMMNEFDYFQDIEKVNRRIDKHNDNINKMEKKKEIIQMKLVNGAIKLPKLDASMEEAELGILPGMNAQNKDSKNIEMNQINSSINQEQGLEEQKKMMEEVLQRDKELKKFDEE